MREAPKSTHRQPPERSNRGSVEYREPTASAEQESTWVHGGGGWYFNVVTGERRKGKPRA